MTPQTLDQFCSNTGLITGKVSHSLTQVAMAVAVAASLHCKVVLQYLLLIRKESNEDEDEEKKDEVTLMMKTREEDYENW